MSGSLLIVSAPSGAGKTSLCSALLAADPLVRIGLVHDARSTSGEENGRHYHFVQPADFERMRSRGDLLENALVHGHQYGTSKRSVETVCAAGNDVLLEIDWQGAAQIRQKLKPDSSALHPAAIDRGTGGTRLRGRRRTVRT